ncbi:MAG: TdeIII family type II restriction endonuclease [Candidatus Marinimicrobia bacterium]|nr:TdeIII family type II restriction endonuclease [Candidatus Neomarinimicrobiota bacterium]
MALSTEQKTYIKDVIKTCIRNKFQKYKPESSNMPFHYRLLGKDRMALYSFIQSLITTFGTSIYEPVAVALAQYNFKKAEAQYVLGTAISQDAQNVIQQIMNDLTTGSDPNKEAETKAIRKVCQKGKMNQLRTVKVDLFVESKSGEKFLFDLKTAKPNISNFKDFKRTLLEWVGIELAKDPKSKVNSLIAIPYNPYEPKPYERWTLKGMLDLNNELKVAVEFWDFLGGKGAYVELLDCFEKAGIELRPEIDKYFARFRK